MEPVHWVAVGSFAFTLISGLVGAFRYISVQVETIRREMETRGEAARLYSDKSTEKEAKARHDVANASQAAIATLTVEMRQLQREAVRHDQMKASEERMLSLLNKIEAKVDRLAETSAEISVIKVSLSAIATRLDDMNKRLGNQ